MSDQHDKSTLNALLSIACKKKEKVNQLQRLTQTQRKFISNEDIDGLLETIDKKDICIKEMDELDRDFFPIYRNIQKKYQSKELNGECMDLYEELREKLESIRSALNKVYEEDRYNMDSIKGIQDKYAGGIKRIQQGTKRQKAYNQVSPIDGGIFIDKKQ